MNDHNFLKKILDKIFNLQRAQQPAHDPLPQPKLYSLLKGIEQTDETELSCGEVFELLDQYAELVVQEKNAADLLPLVKAHLARCRDCQEEYEALVRIITGTETPGA